MLIFGQRHLRTVLAEYARHYNGRRPHRGRDLSPPAPDYPIADLSTEQIKRQAVLGGPINQYEQAALKAQLRTNGTVLKPYPMAALLRTAGHDCAHVYELGLGGQPDEQIMALADRENRILISADTDFGELLANAPVLAPSV